MPTSTIPVAGARLHVVGEGSPSNPPIVPEEVAQFEEGERLEAADPLDAAAVADFDVRLWVDGRGQPPDARAVVLPDVAHMIGMEAPARVAELVVDFLAPVPRWR